MWGPEHASKCVESDLYRGEWSPTTEFIETKAPGGRLSVLQARDHARRRAMGFLVHVIWNMDLAEAYLRSRGKKCL